jgi:hypothetical protein
VENDTPAVRDIRLEEVIIVWAGLLLVTISTLYRVWRA